MDHFCKANSLSEIIEASQKNPVIIFKYSSMCNSSKRLSTTLEKKIIDKKLSVPVYIVVVQKQPVLSKNIAEMFDVKHQSPQILILNKGKSIYTAHHNSIKIENFIFQ